MRQTIFCLHIAVSLVGRAYQSPLSSREFPFSAQMASQPARKYRHTAFAYVSSRTEITELRCIVAGLARPTVV